MKIFFFQEGTTSAGSGQPTGRPGTGRNPNVEGSKKDSGNEVSNLVIGYDRPFLPWILEQKASFGYVLILREAVNHGILRKCSDV